MTTAIASADDICALPADPSQSDIVWPVLPFANAGALSHCHPHCQCPAEAVRDLQSGRYWDPWRRTYRRVPEDDDWQLLRSGKRAPGLSYLSRFIWLRHLAGGWQVSPQAWQAQRALEWLREFHARNPFPKPPYPDQPLAFAFPVHHALNVGHRICSCLDAWAVGLFANSEAGAQAWKLVQTDLERCATAYAKLSVPPCRVGNHYLFEHGMIPFILATLLPQHPNAIELRRHGLSALRRCVDEGLEDDGGYAERSLPYTNTTIDHLLVMMRFCEANQLNVFDSKQWSKLQQFARFILAVPDSAGEAPPLGDGIPECMGGIVLGARQFVKDEAANRPLACYPNPGLCFLRDGEGAMAAHLTFALNGRCLDNYHQHHDVLSILFSLDGVRIIDDHAAYGYNHGHGFADDNDIGRRLRHHRFSARSHNIPCPLGRNRPTLAEYGKGYWGVGKWLDIGGRRQFWGGSPPKHEDLQLIEADGYTQVTASCAMFPPAKHHRTLSLAEQRLVVDDVITEARGNWQLTWHWPEQPVQRDDGLHFRTKNLDVQVCFKTPSETKQDPFMLSLIGDDAGWISEVTMNRSGDQRTGQMVITWRHRGDRIAASLDRQPI